MQPVNGPLAQSGERLPYKQEAVGSKPTRATKHMGWVMSALKKSLKQYDEWIAFWERIVADYPDCEKYRENLGRIKSLRQLAAAGIGRKG